MGRNLKTEVFIDMKKLGVLLKILDDYNMNPDDYAIFGSAPLVITGMVDDVNDLDVIVRPNKWEFGDGGEYRTEHIEFFNNWPGYDIDDLIDNHTFEFKGKRFVNPIKVIEYKRELRRDKDKDIWNK